MAKTQLGLSAGAILPRDMDSRQWASWAGNQHTQSIRSGQTAYNTGTGYFLGQDTDGVTKFSLGTANASGITWNGSTFSVYGNFNWADSTPSALTPTNWDGFSVDPGASFYWKDLSGLEFLTAETAMTGTSDQVYFSFKLAAFDPPISLGGVITAPFKAIDNGTDVLAVAEISDGGFFVCSKFNGTTFDPNGWTAAGTKGIDKLTTLTFYYPSHLWA